MCSVVENDTRAFDMRPVMLISTQMSRRLESACALHLRSGKFYMPVQASSKHSHTQPLKGGVVPYLMLDGAGAAIDFYKQALGAEEIGERVNMEDGRIMNARID